MGKKTPPRASKKPPTGPSAEKPPEFDLESIVNGLQTAVEGLQMEFDGIKNQLQGINSLIFSTKGEVDNFKQNLIGDIQKVVTWHEHGHRGNLYWILPEDMAIQYRKNVEADVIRQYEEEKKQAEEAQKSADNPG